MGIRTFLDNLLASPNPIIDHRVDSAPMLFRGQYDPKRVPEWQRRSADWSLWEANTIRADAVRKSVIVFACLTYLADAVAESDLLVEHLDADGWESATDRAAVALQSLIGRPNPYMDESELTGLLIYQMGIQGYAVVEKVRTRNGVPVELWPLRPDWLYEERDGSYTYRPDGVRTGRAIPAADLIFVPWRHDDRLERKGIGPVQVAAREIGIDLALTDVLKAFLDAGGIPPFVMTYPDVIIDESQIELIQEKWRQKYGGSKAWEELPVLHGGFNIVPIGSDINAMAWPDLRGITELKLCQVFRVPADLVQAYETFQSGNLTTTESDGAMTQLQRYGASPLRTQLAAALGRGLLPDFGLDLAYRLRFDTSGILALQEDTDALHARIRANWDASLLTMDEARTALGLPSLPNNQGQVFKLAFTTVLTPPEQLAGDVAPPVAVPAKTGRVYMDEKRLTPAGLELRAAAVQRLHADRERLVQIGARQIGKFLRAQGVRIAENVAKAQDGHETRDLEAIDWDAEATELERILQKFWMANGEAAYRATAALLGTDVAWQLSDPNIMRLMAILAQRVVGITETTRAQVQQIVAQGLADGRTVREIADDLTAHVEQTYRGRSMTIARTESMYSYGHASVLSYRETGLVEQVELMDNPAHDSDPSPIDGLTCAERHGLIVPIDRAGVHLEAEHPNGSLTILPVLAADYPSSEALI